MQVHDCFQFQPTLKNPPTSSDHNAGGTRQQRGSLETERALGKRWGGRVSHKGNGELVQCKLSSALFDSVKRLGEFAFPGRIPSEHSLTIPLLPSHPSWCSTGGTSSRVTLSRERTSASSTEWTKINFGSQSPLPSRIVLERFLKNRNCEPRFLQMNIFI